MFYDDIEQFGHNLAKSLYKFEEQDSLAVDLDTSFCFVIECSEDSVVLIWQADGLKDDPEGNLVN